MMLSPWERLLAVMAVALVLLAAGVVVLYPGSAQTRVSITITEDPNATPPMAEDSSLDCS